jgi:hypothetical protein
VTVRLADGQTLLVAVPNSSGAAGRHQPGDAVRAVGSPDATRVLPSDTRPPPPTDEAALVLADDD